MSLCTDEETAVIDTMNTYAALMGEEVGQFQPKDYYEKHRTKMVVKTAADISVGCACLSESANESELKCCEDAS